MTFNKLEGFGEFPQYLDYPYEGVMYRWDPVTQKVYLKFYGKVEDPRDVEDSDELFNEAMLRGVEISREQYEAGAEPW
ncbi:MAG: hypothetical protein ACREP7_21650 [Lysobacter sp.]